MFWLNFHYPIIIIWYHLCHSFSPFSIVAQFLYWSSSVLFLLHSNNKPSQLIVDRLNLTQSDASECELQETAIYFSSFCIYFKNFFVYSIQYSYYYNSRFFNNMIMDYTCSSLNWLFIISLYTLSTCCTSVMQLLINFYLKSKSVTKVPGWLWFVTTKTCWCQSGL